MRAKRVAVLALTGATRDNLKSALAIAARYDAKPSLIAVDGGLLACHAIRRRPDLFVGDGDSSGDIPAVIPSVRYPTAKDFSDFAGGLLAAKDLGAGIAVIAGFLGGRLDHEWANLFEAHAATGDFAGLLAPSTRGLVVLTRAGVRARCVPGRLVSLFTLGRGARVSLRGVEYPLVKRRLQPGSLGLSNVSGKALALDVHEGSVVLVFPSPARG